jgi:hypothetical protein
MAKSKQQESQAEETIEQQEQDPNAPLNTSDEPKAEEAPNNLPVEATTPLMPIEGEQHVQEPEQAINVLDVAIEALREAEEEGKDHGHATPEQVFLHHFLPALTAKGLQITAIPKNQ